MSRREFLQHALAGTGIAVAVTMTPLGYRVFSAADAAAGEFVPSVWLTIAPNETVTVMVAKSEMGQGVSTSLPMLVADELEANWGSVRFVFAPADDKFRDPVWGTQATGGSTSIRHLYEPLRLAGAAAREMLIAAAAREWKVPAEECLAANGVVRHKRKLKSFSFGQLTSMVAGIAPPAKPKLKTPQEFRLIGKEIPRLDVPEKVSGAAIFGMDVKVPGMLVAAVAHPPLIGAHPASYSSAAALKIKGVRQIIKLPKGVAVCADSLPAARGGVDVLKIKWEGGDPKLDNASLDARFAKALNESGIKAKETGDPATAFNAAAKKLEATFSLPYLAHATMEPMNCTAHITAERCEVWAPTQNQTGVKAMAEKISGLPADKVLVNTTYLGGGFGRRFETDVVEEALLLAKATGKPVKVIWAREDDFRNDFYRPMNLSRVAASLDSQGKITGWQHKVVCPSIFARVFPDTMKNGVDQAAVEGVANLDYDVPNLSVNYVRIDTPVPVGFWRSVGSSHNAFVVETMMDELAYLAGVDPVEFRLSHLGGNPNAYAVVKTASMRAGWGKPLPSGKGRGFAFHRSFDTNVAMVAEVAVDRKSGRVKVSRVVCAVDCGPVVNPEIVRSQIEGAVCFGLSAALKERVEIAAGGVVSGNFSNYDLLRMNEAPRIEVHLVKGQDKPGGIGEPGVPPIAPAVANAVFAAIGARFRELPLSPKAILKALKKT
ncbi:xanthine dehydrogenase family protein molybdopterin-binding subunit [Geobacter sp. OR-1]|uniref:xanthine dehydrogenase family protein molybdopterin-binding subunit n=1 Tax=Geobacter sp. OR-1 TaxID=1266765 RepID=UPI001364D6B7|nr:xanthine dehydrogenase family protein molybdopterin-binding subunit [Geobacter sp. OR-1]